MALPRPGTRRPALVPMPADPAATAPGAFEVPGAEGLTGG
jgi:hypothetical protein